MKSRRNIFNILIIFVSQLLAIGYSLITKKLLWEYLPNELVGISALFETLFLAIGLIDIGFVSLLSFNLYKSVNEKDEVLICNELSLFKKVFDLIAIIICIISLAILPFLTIIFKITYEDMAVVYTIYIIYLFATFTKFQFTHKICLLNVYQQEYVHRLYFLFFDLVCFLMKIVSIVIFKDYVYYIFSVFITGYLVNLLTGLYVDKHLKYTKRLHKVTIKQLLDSKVIDQCKKYLCKSLYDLVFFATDNLIIGAMVNTHVIGILSNYNIIFASSNMLVTNINTTLRNHLAKFKYNSTVSLYYKEYQRVDFINYMISSVIIVGLYLMRDDFIKLWLDSSFLYDETVINLIIGILGLNLLLKPIESVFMIGGFAFKERLPLIISSITNLVLSIVLLNYIGVIGIYIATLISTIIFWLGKLYYVMKYEYVEYKTSLLLGLFTNVLTFVFTLTLCGIIVDGIVVNSIVLFGFKAICIGAIVVFVNSVVYIVLNYKNNFRNGLNKY